ncbi:uncharacterized protein LOC113326504 [Papaver somniferum]|uniref:uncharacterized protein LOC113326504 n=1 Tax=Papaver somniferum TaxID=3469 RepID=UPI000E6FC380|nr:uncharacterized protein LOC113326504 [Papaver somniferum]
MRPPPGMPHSPNQVCKLHKPLYGLKQAPRAWFEKISNAILQYGFIQSAYDSTMFTRSTKKGMVILLLYVDDMVITGDDIVGITSLKSHLSSCFEMKDLGPLRYFLGIEVDNPSDGCFISQVKYASDILQRARLTDNKTANTPLELNSKINPFDRKILSNPTLYRQLVGSLNYLTITQPDINHVVHIVSQFMSAPRSTHYAAVIRILRYIKGTLYQGIKISSTSDLCLLTYSESDWAGDITDRRSTTGYCLFLGNFLISWGSKKQTVVSRSSAEAEYRSLAHSNYEIFWMRCLLEDMGVHLSKPTPLYFDDKDAIHIAHNDVFHERTKNIEINYHFVRHHFKKQTIDLPFVPSVMQLADLFTKILPSVRLEFFASKLNMCSSPP